ncbi:DUF2897 family protein [Shewanella sp. CG12_big_fil_rev_8_21_14_0_65_47_15]|uniref:DUF2897 family protein n=1 Tax=Shewanella sp. CG12_big_fil_rev_8_21_14_0_65_47_15 TaxID=1975537 RepID=UPI000CAE09B7|nr:DUF2897 family protein [Shewanella sp. CG12_big_fil_rev_8_21_14_0_65_47_15]PIW60529.1 MAG: DUF2897 domain-containing protein [Shewanella sp. CG12_big_fil_rev_8_21_14_0_65_47_15]
MSTLEVWIIIILILGVIASNLAALKYSAKFKLPQFGQHDKNKQLKTGKTQTSAPDKADDEANQVPSSTAQPPSDNKTQHKE